MAVKEDIVIINNYLNKKQINKAMKVLKSNPKIPWQENLATETVPNTILQASAIVTKYAYKVSKLIKNKFRIDSNLYCVTSQIGSWKHNEGLEVHDDTYGAYFTKFSFILYLNTDCEGGELIFPELDVTIIPKPGDLVFFPSHGYWHKVNPVRSGNRSTIVGFYTDVHPDQWESYPEPERGSFGISDYYTKKIKGVK